MIDQSKQQAIELRRYVVLPTYTGRLTISKSTNPTLYKAKMAISIKVLLFASAREAAGNISETSLTLDEGANTATFR